MNGLGVGFLCAACKTCQSEAQAVGHRSWRRTQSSCTRREASGKRSKRLNTTALEPIALKENFTGAMALTSRNYPARLNIRLRQSCRIVWAASRRRGYEKG